MSSGVSGQPNLLVVHTIDYRILYVFFFFSHERRELIHFNVTTSPTAAWIWQQLLEATPWGRKPAYLIHDRDRVYDRDFDVRASRLGIAGVRTPPRAPTLSLQSPVPQTSPGYGLVVSTPVLRRPAPCLRAGGLNSDDLLPPHTLRPGRAPQGEPGSRAGPWGCSRSRR
jgi:hypothetical protein